MAWIRRYPVPVAYLVLALVHVGVVTAADKNVKDDPVAGVIALAVALFLILAAVPLRRRWAWWIDLVIHVIALVLIVFESVKLLAWVTNVIELGLLLSPQMRGFIDERQPRKLHPAEKSTLGWLRSR